jgi:hypothetical protein
VVIRQAHQVAVLHEHGRHSYFALVDPPAVEKRRPLKRPQRSLTRATLYRDRVLARAARRQRQERSLQGRLWRLGRRIREVMR